jgi:hypothetical protein
MGKLKLREKVQYNIGKIKIKDCITICEGCPTRSKATDLRSVYKGIREFESHHLHIIFGTYMTMKKCTLLCRDNTQPIILEV